MKCHTLFIMLFLLFFNSIYATVKGETTTQQEQPKQKIIVEVLMFSGVPNPRFYISNVATISDLTKRLSGLNRVYDSAGYGIGFTGYRLYNAGVPGFPEQLDVIWNKRIVFFEGEKQQIFSDDNNLFERLTEETLNQNFDDPQLMKILHSWIPDVIKKRREQQLIKNSNSANGTILNGSTMQIRKGTSNSGQPVYNSKDNEQKGPNNSANSAKDKHISYSLMVILILFITIIMLGLIKYINFKRKRGLR